MSATLAEALLQVAKAKLDGAVACAQHEARSRAVELIDQAGEALAKARDELKGAGP